MIETIPFPAAHGATHFAADMPVVFEDEGQDDMGDSRAHTSSTGIFFYCVQAHLSGSLEYETCSNLNLYYHPTERNAYVSPDVMVVAPYQPLGDISSYRIGDDGPAPLLVIEVLSPRTAQQGDLTVKPTIYADLGVPEYILVDPSGRYLKRRLVNRRLQANGRWLESQDEDGGVTSALGFRAFFDTDGWIRVLNTATGQPYPRPHEALSEARARIHADEARLQAEAEARIADEARLQAEAEARIANEARLQAEAVARIADAARFKAEAEKRAADESRFKAEADKRAADERIREMEIELSRLRGEKSSG